MTGKQFFDSLTREERVAIVNSDARKTNRYAKTMESRINECITDKIASLSCTSPKGNPCVYGFICGGFAWPLDIKYRMGKATDSWCRHCARVNDVFKRVNDPEYARKKQRARRARKTNTLSDNHTREDVFAKTGGICYLCLLPITDSTWHESHGWSVAKGGNSVLDNTWPAHASCNLKIGINWV